MARTHATSIKVKPALSRIAAYRAVLLIIVAGRWRGASGPDGP